MLIRTGFDDGDAKRSIVLLQPRCQHTAGEATSNDDIVDHDIEGDSLALSTQGQK